MAAMIPAATWWPTPLPTLSRIQRVSCPNIWKRMITR
ncbi:MAG: hypothetical protein IIZ75_08755 [Lachnospiraceae bacterium]|nr:hypothetical protein [Lachnospiraceae bacterium]